MSRLKPKMDFVDPAAGPVLTPRFVVAIVLMVLGLAWIAFYYVHVRPDPDVFPAPKPGSPHFIASLHHWNYLIGFGAFFLGLAISAHPLTPLGRNRGVVIGMLGCFLLGLAWIITYYIFSNDISKVPVFDDLGQYNLVVGIAFMGVGFTFATRWE